MRYVAFGSALVAAFVFWHSGSRAGAVCLREAFVSSGELSLWPPGARCTYGEPALHDTFVNPWFLATAFVLVTVFVLAGVVRDERRVAS